MAVFMEMELPVTPDQYDAVDAALDPKGDPPDGLIAHTRSLRRRHPEDPGHLGVAGGIRGVRRIATRPGRSSETLGDDCPAAPEPKFTELHNAYSRLTG